MKFYLGGVAFVVAVLTAACSRPSSDVAKPSMGMAPNDGPSPTTRPTLQSFCQVTLRVVERDGISVFLPTVMIDRQLSAIADIPPGVDHRQAVQDFIETHRPMGGDVLFGVKSGANEITVGCLSGGSATFKAIVPTADGYAISDAPKPPWWRLGS